MSQTLSGPMAWRKREHACVEGRQRPLPLFHASFSYMHQHDCDAIAWPGASTVRIAERERKPSGLRPPALACVQEGGQEVSRWWAGILTDRQKPVKRLKTENSFFSHCSQLSNACTWSTTLTWWLERCLRCGRGLLVDSDMSCSRCKWLTGWYLAQLFPCQCFTSSMADRRHRCALC